MFLQFCWPFPHFPGPKHHFCIQSGRRMEREEGEATPAVSLSLYQGNKSFPEFTLVPKTLLLGSHCPESGHMAIPSYRQVWGTELYGLLLQTKWRLCQHGRRYEWILVCNSSQPYCTDEKTETQQSSAATWTQETHSLSLTFVPQTCGKNYNSISACSVSTACSTFAKVMGLTIPRIEQGQPEMGTCGRKRICLWFPLPEMTCELLGLFIATF